jgi:hypothetical protein
MTDLYASTKNKSSSTALSFSFEMIFLPKSIGGLGIFCAGLGWHEPAKQMPKISVIFITYFILQK